MLIMMYRITSAGAVPQVPVVSQSPMTVFGEKRCTSSMDVDMAIEDQQASCDKDASLLDNITHKIKSDEKEEILQGLGLLAAVSIPLDVLLNDQKIRPILARLFSLMGKGSSFFDLELAAESTGVFKCWLEQTENEEQVRLLYAHCVFPEIISLFPKIAKLFESLAEMNKDELLFLEHLLSSVLIIVNAFIEEIPAALMQLNSSSLGYLSAVALEKSMFLPEDTIRILLKCLLCASEDNADLFNAVDMIRIQSLLEKIHAPLNIHGLALGLLASLKNSVSIESISQLIGIINAIDTNNCGCLIDLLSILSNMITQVDKLPTEAIDNIFQWYQKFPLLLLTTTNNNETSEQVEGNDKHEQFDQTINALSICLLPLADRFDGRASLISRWEMLCSILEMHERLSITTLGLLAQICRDLVLGGYQNDCPPCYSPATDLVIKEILKVHLTDDDIVAGLASLAVILDSKLDFDWNWQLLQALLHPSRSIDVIIAAVEIAEKLAEVNPDSVRGILVDATPSVLDHCRRIAKKDQKEELSYIKTTLDNLVSSL